ncbi:ABC transporter ATP-binding protein [Candidatus Micrarchaeota archaeon]|nr:ABC transporter ATP-binding protein [Candidatus Micrarchaeota archaeon]
MVSVLELKNITKKYSIDGNEIIANDDISFSLKKRESIALVGPSGCGKTTLIRLIAGLEVPTSGVIEFEGKPITGPIRQIMMVFQSFAIFPWKTVQENVELALLDKPESERSSIATKFVDLVGLGGFEASYPRELSGGMKQRVGIARAICREPDILLLDEPFSALDALTANNLRNEVLRFYLSKKNKPDILILVTHNIEEAVYMANRVVVLSKRPGKVLGDIKIDLPFPRNKNDPKFASYVDQVTSLISS